MMSSTYLAYEVALLLAKYGKNAVLNELATKMQLTHAELESLLMEIPIKKGLARSKKASAAVDSIDEIIRQHPAKAHFLRTLQARFQNRTFLPELRDVRRFLERHSTDLGSTKSRTESFPLLFKLLAELDLTELDELCEAEPQSTYSSLGIISDEILRQHK
jgi:hypothetical protein